ncbi:MAG: hypothetical protein AB1814_10320 [Thermodesulfobacteriota bacterium]
MADCSQLNAAQTVFCVFYAVLYGAMLNSINTFKPNQWGFIKEKSRRRVCQLLRRLVCSLILFTIAPLIIFSVEFYFWGTVKFNLLDFDVSLIYLPAIAASALSIYAPYRFYHIIFIFGARTVGRNYILNSKKCYLLYDYKEYCEIEQDRGLRLTVSGQLLAIGFYASAGFLAWGFYLFLAVFLLWLVFFVMYCLSALKVKWAWNIPAVAVLVVFFICFSPLAKKWDSKYRWVVDCPVPIIEPVIDSR